MFLACEVFIFSSDVFICLWVVYVRRRHYGFFFSCFTCSTLAIDLYYEVIHDMSFILCFCEIKKLFCFTCIFHTCVYVFVECFRNIQVDSVVLLSTLATDRW